MGLEVTTPPLSDYDGPVKGFPGRRDCALIANVSHPDQVLGVPTVRYTKPQVPVYYAQRWAGETKRTSKREWGTEAFKRIRRFIDQHVPGSNTPDSLYPS